MNHTHTRICINTNSQPIINIRTLRLHHFFNGTIHYYTHTGSSGRCQLLPGPTPTATIPPSVSTKSTTSEMTETATTRITPCKLTFNHRFACYRKPPLYVMIGIVLVQVFQSLSISISILCSTYKSANKCT